MILQDDQDDVACMLLLLPLILSIQEVFLVFMMCWTIQTSTVWKKKKAKQRV